MEAEAAKSDVVHDEEVLYRGFKRRNIQRNESGEIEGIGPDSFSDRYMRPSVDRAHMIQSDAQQTFAAQPESIGVAQIVAGSVRRIRNIPEYNDKQKLTGREHAVDVEPKPLPENEAHAEIFLNPRDATKGTFNRLKVQLALLAVIILLEESSIAESAST